MTNAREQVIAGLVAAIRDIECPPQFSPLLMEAAKLLRKLTPPEPTDTNRAETILREFEELHGPITIDERKWLRDRIATEISPPEPIEGHPLPADFGRVIEAAWDNEPTPFSRADVAVRVVNAVLRAMPLQDHDWQDISTAPKDERVELFNELWECTFGEIQIGILDDDGKWSFDSGMNVYDTDNDAGNQDDGLAEIDFTPTHWRPLPRRPMVAEDGISEAKS